MKPCVLQDDLKKFVSEPQPPPHEVEISEEGKTKAKERWEVGEGDDTVIWRTRPTRTTTRRRCRTASSCGRGSAVPACLMCPSCKIRRLAWRLVWLRRHGGRATPPTSG
jgi:hypothetical protein